VTYSDFLRLVLVMFLWAVCFPLIVMGLELAPHFTFAALRAGLAGAVLIAIGAVLDKPLPKDWRIWGRLFLVGLGATSLGFIGMFHAAEFVSPGAATVIANTQPLMTALAAHYFLKERLHAWGVFGLVMAFGGIFLLAVPNLVSREQDGFGVGIGYLALAAVGIATANILMKRLAGRVDPIMAMGLQILLGGIPLGLMALAIEDPTETIWSLRFILSLLGLALFGTALVFWLWFSVLGRVELTLANSFSFLVSLFGLGIGVAVFDERLDGIQAVGVALTIFGVLAVCRDRGRNRSRDFSSPAPPPRRSGVNSGREGASGDHVMELPRDGRQ